MITIKLKDTQKQDPTTLYKSGQFFRDTDGCIFVLLTVKIATLSIAIVKEDWVVVINGEKIQFSPNEATLNFLNENISETLTPISVTISED